MFNIEFFKPLKKLILVEQMKVDLEAFDSDLGSDKSRAIT